MLNSMSDMKGKNEFASGAFNIYSSDDDCLVHNDGEIFQKDQTVSVNIEIDSLEMTARVVNVGTQEEMIAALENMNSQSDLTDTENPPPQFQPSTPVSRIKVKSSSSKRSRRIHKPHKFSTSDGRISKFASSTGSLCSRNIDEGRKEFGRLFIESIENQDCIWEALQREFQPHSSRVRSYRPTSTSDDLKIKVDGEYVSVQELNRNEIIHVVNESRKTMDLDPPPLLDLGDMELSIGACLKFSFKTNLRKFTILIAEYLIDEAALKISFMPSIDDPTRSVVPRKSNRRVLSEEFRYYFKYCVLYFGGACLEEENTESQTRLLMICRSNYNDYVSHINRTSNDRHYYYKQCSKYIFNMDNAF